MAAAFAREALRLPTAAPLGLAARPQGAAAAHIVRRGGIDRIGRRATASQHARSCAQRAAAHRSDWSPRGRLWHARSCARRSPPHQEMTTTRIGASTRSRTTSSSARAWRTEGTSARRPPATCSTPASGRQLGGVAGRGGGVLPRTRGPEEVKHLRASAALQEHPAPALPAQASARPPIPETWRAGRASRRRGAVGTARACRTPRGRAG